MRLIDADSVNFTNFEIVMCEGDFKQAFKLLCEKLDNAPTVDAVEIVRCRECIHLQKSGQCDKTHLWIGTKEGGGCDDFFCGFGGRADTEPVRYGHWVRNDNGTYSCSECHSWIPDEQHYYARYCLLCGARMADE